MIRSSRQLVKDFIASERSAIGAAFLAALIGSIVNVLLPLSIGKFYDISLNEHSVKGALIDRLGLTINDISSFFLFFISLILCRAVFAFLSTYFLELCNEKFSNYLRIQLFEAQLNQTVEAFQSKEVGKYLLRYSGDMSAVQNLLTKGKIQFYADGLFLLLALVALYLMDPLISLTVVVTMGVGFIMTYQLAKMQQVHLEKEKSTRSGLLHFVENRFNHFTTIKIFNRVRLESEKFLNKNNQLLAHSKKAFLFQSLIQALLPLLFFAAIGVILFIHIHNHSGQNSNSQLLVAILLVLYMQSVFKRILRLPSIWKKGNSSLLNIQQTLAFPQEPRLEGELTSAETTGHIQLENVQFSYNQKNAFQHPLTYKFLPGTITCVVGKHGTGKSTLTKLLLSIYSPSAGSILLDDLKYESLTPFEIRKKITVVSEIAPLLGSSIFQCISYNRKEDKRTTALNLLNDLQFRNEVSTEEILDIAVMPQASNLSSGERKLLQFARALLTRKKIMVLDDPFESLDEIHKQIIIRKLQSIRHKRTIILLCNDVPIGIELDQILYL
jgi:ATP-binding cassette subfamily B multidrug efflux pump